MASKVEAKESEQAMKDVQDDSTETKEEEAVVELPVELQPWDDWDHFYKSTKEEKDFWSKFTPHELGIIFTRGPIPLLHRAWGKLDRGDAQSLMDANADDGTLKYWDPFILRNREERLYHSYSPVILETRPTPLQATEDPPFPPGLDERKRVLAFHPPHHDRKQRPGCWFAMPSLSFLPPGVNKVIAGDGGLLVCDGAMQWTTVVVDGKLSPFSARPPVVQGGRPVPMEPDAWTRDNNLPGQSILLMCNPVTRELMYLPPFHRTMSLNAKSACIRYMDFAELVPTPPTPPLPPEEEKVDVDVDEDGGSVEGADTIEKIVQRASRRGTLIEKKLEKRMSSVPFAQGPMLRKESVHMDLDDELDELDLEEGTAMGRRRSSRCASDDVHMPGEVEKAIEGRFQRIQRLYFECFGRTPMAMLPPSRHYVVVVMGCNEETKLHGHKDHTLVCAVYDSQKQGEWSYIRPMPCNARTMPVDHGRTGLALLTSLGNKNWMAACFGGLVLIDIEEGTGYSHRNNRRNRDTSSVDICSATSSSTSSSSSSSHGAKAQEKYHPPMDKMSRVAVFFVSMVPEDDTVLIYPFKPDGYDDKVLTCPIILQPFGVRNPEIVVAVARKACRANKLIIFGVEFEHDVVTEHPRPNGMFSWISESPPSLYRELFITPDVSNKPFECSAGNGLISFKATDGQRLAMYDMYTARWWIEDFHRYIPCKRKEKPFQLLEVCSWEPNFRQRAEYDWRYFSGRPNPITQAPPPPPDATTVEPVAVATKN